MKWEYKGRKLANPFTIIKRLICYILIWPFVIPLYIILWVGWGKYAADQMLGTIG